MKNPSIRNMYQQQIDIPYQINEKQVLNDLLMNPRHKWYLSALILLLKTAFPSTFFASEPIDLRTASDGDPSFDQSENRLVPHPSGTVPEPFRNEVRNSAERFSAQLQLARDLGEVGCYKEAFQIYSDIVRWDPQNALAWNERGLVAFQMKNFEEALSSFQAATAWSPVNGFFHESLAWVRMCRGEYSQAVESAKIATLIYHKNRKYSIYPLLIAYFSYAESGDSYNAKKTLDYALRNKTFKGWPTSVVDFLAGRIDKKQLISQVTNLTQETQAQTYIGLHHRINKDLEAAHKHLDWVARKGDRKLFEYTLSCVLMHDNRDRSESSLKWISKGPKPRSIR